MRAILFIGSIFERMVGVHQRPRILLGAARSLLGGGSAHIVLIVEDPDAFSPEPST